LEQWNYAVQKDLCWRKNFSWTGDNKCYKSVDCCDERGIESQAAKLNVEIKMTLLQKEKSGNRKKILQLEQVGKI
jgi:hypothetical protein